MSQYAPIVAALVTMLLTFIILFGKFGGAPLQNAAPRLPVVDDDAPPPRFGGVGMMAGMLSGWALMLLSTKWWILLPLAGLFIVSLLSSVYGLSAKKRLLAHGIAAIILVTGSPLADEQGWWMALIVLPLALWSTNLYNRMDGSDGLASGMALIGFTTYGVAALMNHDETLALMSFTVGAAALGFWYYCWPPAKTFMGEIGAVPLGFLAAAFGVWGGVMGHWNIWFPLLVFSPFLLDASATLAKRALCRKSGAEHYYQRLLDMGWPPLQLLYLECLLMLGAAASAVVFMDDPFPLPLFLVWGVIYFALGWRIDTAWKKSNLAQHA
jgi:UDP-N-acetylmuramyl pentapeptide phosphotransferase/UDP-N-acetylglucosamine-1-phosphate transferase